ncbi:MAG: hypothetical protein M3Y85_06220 [Bacteroidota bacterium]|nr:hypothetical protein [Bacteroidota bacterium]
MDALQLQEFSDLRFKDKLGQNKKNIIAFGCLLLFACLLLASTFFFASYGIAKAIQLVGFLALGYMHLSIMHGNLAILTPTEKLLYSLLLAITIFLIYVVFFLVTKQYGTLLILSNCCAFILFFVTDELWRLYNAASAGKAALWHYSNNAELDQSREFIGYIPIIIKVQIEQHGRVEFTVSFRAPVEMKLSHVFCQMILKQNESGRIPVHFADKNNRPFGWVFFTIGLGGWSKYLNPEETLIENGITDNSVIVVRRVATKFLKEVPMLQRQTN